MQALKRGLAAIAALVLIGAVIAAVSRPVQLAFVNAPALWFPGTITRDVVFDDETGLALDIYQPAGDRTNRPVVIFLYGGSWRTGDRGMYTFMGLALARQGYVAVIPDYRKYPDVRFPDFVTDAARAVAWTKRNAARLDGDPDDIVLTGHSAGAHIGMLLLTDKSYLQKAGATGAVSRFAGLAGP